MMWGIKIRTGVARNDEKSGGICVTIAGEDFWFWRKFENEGVRKIVVTEMEEALDRRIREIRKKAYEQGKKAARKRDHKVTEFNGCINGDWLGYNTED